MNMSFFGNSKAQAQTAQTQPMLANQETPAERPMFRQSIMNAIARLNASDQSKNYAYGRKDPNLAMMRGQDIKRILQEIANKPAPELANYVGQSFFDAAKSMGPSTLRNGGTRGRKSKSKKSRTRRRH